MVMEWEKQNRSVITAIPPWRARMSIKAGLHSVTAMALLPAGTPPPVLCLWQLLDLKGPRNQSFCFIPFITKAWRLDAGVRDRLASHTGCRWNLGCGCCKSCGSQSSHWCWPGFQGDAVKLFLPWDLQVTWGGLWAKSRMCQYLACLVRILSPKLPSHPTTACPRYPEMLELPWELVGCRTSLLSTINVAK